MNKIFLEQLAELELDIIKLANQLNVKLEDCQRATEKRVAAESMRKTMGRNPNIESFIGAAYINVQAACRLVKNFEYFIRNQVPKETLERMILSRFKRAAEAYGVALGGHELHRVDHTDKELRNEEYRKVASDIQNKNPTLNQSDIVRAILKLYGLPDTSFRQIYRIIFKN